MPPPKKTSYRSARPLIRRHTIFALIANPVWSTHLVFNRTSTAHRNRFACKPKSPLNTNSLLALVVVVGDFFCRSFGGFSGLTSCTTHSPALPPHASAPYKLPKKFSGSVPENLGERCNFHWFSTANNVTSGDIH